MTIKYTKLALNDLDRIACYYTEHVGAERSALFVDRIVATLDRLISRNPQVGRPRPELGDDIRSFPVLPYIAFYRVYRRYVLVVRVLHGHRNIHPPLASLLLAV